MVPERPMRTLWGQLGCWLVQVQAPAQKRSRPTSRRLSRLGSRRRPSASAAPTLTTSKGRLPCFAAPTDCRQSARVVTGRANAVQELTRGRRRYRSLEGPTRGQHARQGCLGIERSRRSALEECLRRADCGRGSAPRLTTAVRRVEVWRGGFRLSMSVCRPFRLAVP